MRKEPLCPFCCDGDFEVETEFHLLWRCPAWDATRQPLRTRLLAALTEAHINTDPHTWPTCASHCGLIPTSWGATCTTKQLHAVGVRLHAMAVAILLDRMYTEESTMSATSRNTILFPDKPVRGGARMARDSAPPPTATASSVRTDRAAPFIGPRSQAQAALLRTGQDDQMETLRSGLAPAPDLRVLTGYCNAPSPTQPTAGTPSS
jgi:hypothetical protein